MKVGVSAAMGSRESTTPHGCIFAWRGERQRIAVARAFLRDAPILILDEPTSATDSKTETVILDALGGVRGQDGLMVASICPST